MDVTVDDAILYLDQVKMELTDRPSIYTEFLEVKLAKRMKPQMKSF